MITLLSLTRLCIFLLASPESACSLEEINLSEGVKIPLLSKLIPLGSEASLRFAKQKNTKSSLIFFLTAGQPADTQQEDISRIDRQIEQLEDIQRKYRSSAERNANNAMRWQFQNENYLDARRAWDKVAQDKQKIKEIQMQIDDLQRRRQELSGKESPS